MKLKAQNLKKLMARVMTLVMVIALLPNVFLQDVQAVKKEEAGYEIYPIPQSVEYNAGTLSLGNDVNVIFEEGIDDATKNRLIEVLAIKGISYEITTEVKSDKTNFLVGLYNSNGIVDNYFTDNNLSDSAHFENFDSIFARCLIRFLISITPCGSNPFVGSSKITILGLFKNALAIAKRCFIPNE
jgi:hyaluronoglucosaminidase